MCSAVVNKNDWRKDNTEVMYSPSRDVCCVYLHKNLIATINNDTVEVYDGGWQSNTTKSRLNALCDAFCIAGERVFQKDFTWYVRHFVGKINGKDVFQNNIFTNGYTFA